MMSDEIIRIPFLVYNRQGSIEVEYKINTSPAVSGFDILKDIVPDLTMCIGYPTVRAYVKEYPGNGYYRYYGWIQVLRIEFYSAPDRTDPDDIHYDADVTPVMKENRLPFFAYGYPAELYDAPCNNFFSGARLVWQADTFLVSMPSYINDNSISYLAGFHWGYTECTIESKKHVEIVPLKIVDSACWEKHLDLFRREFSNWSFN